MAQDNDNTVVAMLEEKNKKACQELCQGLADYLSGCGVPHVSSTEPLKFQVNKSFSHYVAQQQKFRGHLPFGCVIDHKVCRCLGSFSGILHSDKGISGTPTTFLVVSPSQIHQTMKEVDQPLFVSKGSGEW